MKKIFAAILILSAVTAVDANMRAPWGHQSMPSRTIKSSCADTLTVIKEELSFFCEYPYEGNISEVVEQKKYTDITAVYYIKAETSTECSFEFVMPHNVPIKAIINGSECTVKKTAQSDDTYTPHNRFDKNLYSAVFTGKIRPGENIISIQYRQLADVWETAYGYFTRSRFSTSVTYELWPLKEWKLSDTFSLTVNVKVQDYSSIRRSIFGSRNSIRIFEGKKEGNQSYTAYSKGVYTQEKDYLNAKAVYGKDFPDILSFSYGED